jgi:ABC-2 type transport system permease protein
MSATTIPVVAPAANIRATQQRVAMGEWIKLRTVRSNIYTIMGAGFAMLFFGIVFSALAGDSKAATGPGARLTDPVAISLSGSNMAQIIIAVLGVLAVAGEYSTGLIRTGFVAAGSRLRVLRAKVLVIGTVAFVSMTPMALIAFVVGQSVYAGNLPTASLGDDGVLRVIFGTGFYIACVAMMGVALGFILRSTAAAIATLVVTLLMLPTLLELLPDSITDPFLKFLPSKAGSAITALNGEPGLLSSTSAFIVAALWAIVPLGVAAVVVQRRDA